MTLISKNQNDILEAFELDDFYENKPINRLKKAEIKENKFENLQNLKKLIENIKDCKLKDNANKIVFSDGDFNSPIMFVGEGPGQIEDDTGKPFMGEAGLLFNKMLKAINMNRNKIYITNIFNYKLPNNRQPEKSEINRYAEFLKKHISIINPEILILMGSTAMESILGTNIKISQIRGDWKEIIINNKTFKVMVTFHPAYLLRRPEQKKYSWIDLKKIKEKMKNYKLI